ncbi:hypothetical protein [Mycobacterium sp. 236(2023)]|uniref:hypothetical protein n=1 Tax=Mycobacterium sp. 236(2023) TaxID=3038163 RepID=UPI002414E205|nr:hypothetical protein [Mycobacterium sp. 236(2023)]MDG4665207.1 hypothetical protein [Mycobacterium sp. 236(2023)]
MPSKPSSKSLAWPLFDAIVDRSALKDVNPWQADGFAPDYDALRKLLAVPILLGAESRSGVPALALDVWVAYELRRAGLDPDAVWPRAEAPRVVDRDVLNFVKSIPKAARKELMERLRAGGGIGAASANIAGKNYFKQVDVIMSSWQTGPELLISTKRMDSSFGKNAANRVEESYGDAKNLALRHPLAALGFMYSLRSTAYSEERRQFDWIVDLLIKLGREDDAYDACALVVPEWEGDAPPDGPPAADDAVIEPYLFDIDEPDDRDAPTVDVSAQLAALPEVTLRTDLVPAELSPARFFARMLTIVLDNSNITQHEEARLRRSQVVG